ncbi:phosphatase [Mycobacterium tuberculosis]|nr:phosphatase [Mycobacterium tuberculosis]
MARRARVDAELVRRGLARSRQQAAELIGAGKVRIEAGDERARAALQRWSLMRSDHPVTSVGTQ